MENNINIDKETLDKLEKAYIEARKDMKPEFNFGDNIFVTDFAQYLIEYSKERLGLKIKNNYKI